MDLGNTVSPDWVNRSKSLTSKLPREWTSKQETDATIVVTTTNELDVVLALPSHGRFLSTLLFDKRLILFLDSFLTNRTRLDTNGASCLDDLDVCVFGLFERFVQSRTAMPSFSPASELKSFDEALSLFLTPTRLIQLGALYHEPSVQSEDAYCALIADSARSRPRLPRDVLVYLERSVQSPTTRIGLRTISGMRALLVDARLGYLDAGDHVVGEKLTWLGHQDVQSTLKALSLAYSATLSDTSADPTSEEKEHVLTLLECVLIGMSEPTTIESNVDALLHVLTNSDEISLMWRDFVLTRPTFFSEKLRSLLTEKDHFDAQVEYLKGIVGVMDENASKANLPALPNTKALPEPKPPNLDVRVDEASSSTIDDPNVDTLQELAPQLSKEFCKRLLAAVDGNLERAITCVFEERYPPGISPDSIETVEPPAVHPVVPQPQALRRNSGDEPDFNAVALDDADVRARILDNDDRDDYDLYEDEDDEYEEERGVVGVDDRASAEREVFIDPNDGTMRDANGKLITEEEMEVMEQQNILRRPNTNRERAAPSNTSRKRQPRGGRQQGDQPKPELTPQQIQERVKRDRARKEQSGSYARQKGAAKKAARTNPGP